MRWLLLMIGLILCGAGAVLFEIELLKQPSYVINKQLEAGDSVDKNDLLQVLERQKEISSWGWKDAELLKTVSFIEYALANSNGASPDASLLDASAAHLAEGLALSPADPFSWFRLVRLRMRAAALPEDITQALHMAVVTGPVITQLIAPRLRLAVVYWDYLPEADQQLFMAQIKMLKLRNPQEAAKLAAMNDRNQKLFSTLGH